MTATARRANGRSADGQVVGAMLVLGGVGWLLHRSGAIDISWGVLLSGLLIVLGAGLVVTARRRGGSGLVVLGVAMTVVLASSSSLDIDALEGGFGQRTRSPDTVTNAKEDNALGIGVLEVDLTGLEIAPGEPVRLSYSVGAGALEVLLPPIDADPDLRVKVVASARAGHLEVLGREDQGPDVRDTVTEPGFDAASKQLILLVAVTFGNLSVERAPF